METGGKVVKTEALNKAKFEAKALREMANRLSAFEKGIAAKQIAAIGRLVEAVEAL